jgi:hypothetical protein
MKIKKPSLKGIKNTEYLGHFAQDKYIEKGHNLSGKESLQAGAERRRKYRELIRANLAKGASTELSFDKPVEKMSAEEKSENARQYKEYLDIYEEEANKPVGRFFGRGK